MTEPQLTVEEVTAFLEEVFPQVRGEATIDHVAPYQAVMRLKVGERHLRPGGTVSGPTMFMMADVSFYVAVLAMIGREALTVTSNVSINFLRKPGLGDLTAHARILKLGRTLATGDAMVHSEGIEGPVAHAVLSYAIPQTSSRR